uniref:Pecanex-like protein n=1 Tax=Haemonchus placei TaxID=6290 RepID=A0A0N4VYR9_HAEPC
LMTRPKDQIDRDNEPLDGSTVSSVLRVLSILFHTLKSAVLNARVVDLSNYKKEKPKKVNIVNYNTSEIRSGGLPSVVAGLAERWGIMRLFHLLRSKNLEPKSERPDRNTDPLDGITIKLCLPLRFCFRESYKGGTGERFALARPKDQIDRNTDPLDGSTINRESYKGGIGERLMVTRPENNLHLDLTPFNGMSQTKDDFKYTAPSPCPAARIVSSKRRTNELSKFY